MWRANLISRQPTARFYGLVHIPIDGLVSHFFEGRVAAAEAPTAQKGRTRLGRTEWTRMTGLNDRVTTGGVIAAVVMGDQLHRFGRGGLAPQQKDATLARTLGVAIDGANNGVRHFLPPAFLMGVGFPASDRQDRIQEEDTLLGPANQVTVFRQDLILWKRNGRILR